MPTTFPTTVDTFDVVNASDADIYAVLRALQRKLGIDASVDTTSIDFKVHNTKAPAPGTGTGGGTLARAVQSFGGFMVAAQRGASDFPVSATQQELLSQPAGYKFSDYVVEIIEPFVQSVPGSPTIDIGTVASPSAFVSGGNLAQARGNFVISPPVMTLSGLQSLVAATSIKVRVNYTGSLTRGEFRVHLKYDYVADVGLAAPSTFGPLISLPPDEPEEDGLAIVRGGGPQPLISIGH